MSELKVKKMPTPKIPTVRDRWTVLYVQEKSIEKIIKYSNKYNRPIGDILSEVIDKALS